MDISNCSAAHCYPESGLHIKILATYVFSLRVLCANWKFNREFSNAFTSYNNTVQQILGCILLRTRKYLYLVELATQNIKLAFILRDWLWLKTKKDFRFM